MQLLLRIERHLRHTRMSPTRFGREAMRDPRFVLDLRHGRKPKPPTIARALAWLDAREGTRIRRRRKSR
jgi:2,4-dienoyl-CoA reductase-like NADH-dependent reductase (Old Yellow Enzyme family)